MSQITSRAGILACLLCSCVRLRAVPRAHVASIQIERRALGPNDVRLDVLYCRYLPHTDIHIARLVEWRPAKYPIVPGHEINGRVRAVGSAVTKFKVEDIGGVGCMVEIVRHLREWPAPTESRTV